jgi:branched-chain amino acid aminotransferase
MTAITFIDGRWVEGNPPLLGPMTHATWMASVVFDGARAFDGVAPDLAPHCARLLDSARAMGFESPVDAARVEELAWDGIARFSKDAMLYIRPLIYTEDGFVAHKPGSERFILSVFEEPMPTREALRTCLSPWRRPGPEMAPTLAKTSCLYPNVARMLRLARGNGFDNALVLDPLGNVAEFATANLFLARDGVVFTPVPNGTFLAGITRARVMALLRVDGIEVREATLTLDDVRAADELFATGNYSKVMAVVGVDDKEYQPGPIARRARSLYFDWAKTAGKRPG